MSFNSVTFLVFFALVYAAYVVLPHRWQNRLLLAASLFFYGCWDWRFLGLLLASSLLDYVCGLRIESAVTPGARKRWLALSIVGNLGMLGYFKYANFFIDSFARLLTAIGFATDPFVLRIVLPVGISFYTFQTMSYTIDVYRGKLAAARDPLDFALFVSFFPQLVAGPIERATALLPQVATPRRLDARQIGDGLFLVGWGLFKKVVIADGLAPIVEHHLADFAAVGRLGVMLGLYAFVLQLYGDFSGYSDIARGLAKTMGFELMENFHLPFFARRPSQFWARWHISLSTWVRDYLFLSLGSARDGTWKTAWKNVVSMTLMGLWHGAAWTFVLWGFTWGVVQAGYGLIRPWLKRAVVPRTDAGRAVVAGASMFLMFHAFCVSGILFRAEDLGHSLGLMRTLLWGVSAGQGVGAAAARALLLVAPLVVMQLAQARRDDMLVFQRQGSLARFAWVSAAVFMALATWLYGDTSRQGQEFIYFQF